MQINTDDCDLENAQNQSKCDRSFTLLTALTCIEKMPSMLLYSPYSNSEMMPLYTNIHKTILISNRFTPNKDSNKLLSHDTSQPLTYERYFGAMWMECVRRVSSDMHLSMCMCGRDPSYAPTLSVKHVRFSMSISMTSTLSFY